MSEPVGAVGARQLVELQRYADALPLLAGLLAEAPDDVELHALLAQVHLGLDELPEALAEGNRVVAPAPDDEWGHRVCAVVLNRIGRRDQAVQAAREAVRAAPYAWRTHQAYAMVAVDARGLLPEARAAAIRAVELAPNEPGAHFAVGLVAQAQADAPTARAAYQRTLALDPQHARALNNLTALRGHGNLTRAARGYGSSLRHDPGLAVARRNVDALAAVLVRRIYVAGTLAFLVGLVVSAAAGGVTAWSAGLAVLLLAGSTAYAVRTARAVPVGVRRYVATRLRRDPYLIASQLLALAMVVCALVVCLVPDGAALGLTLLRPVGLANVGLFVWTMVKRHA